ncbi:hypothetical protein VCHA30O60_100079 [Vibrio chagasii]|nr:hypothetical protein VCHA30O60_100079 [Vibrio chagasii]
MFRVRQLIDLPCKLSVIVKHIPNSDYFILIHESAFVERTNFLNFESTNNYVAYSIQNRGYF